ncbi:type II secretion system F family protein [Cohnella fermenti]|uniref:Type II secretion system F family protein n=1 Tax=Cohnella fermenti TaxID=2565925 RepID=A0A4S4C8U4_9BACL|nr:type II secretion system F family protein [Cohnella fermenti]THF82191.1 type II secretion system F family protein [Cohnella fermenti]
MPTYNYVAVDARGAYRRGSIESRNENYAIDQLRSNGLRIVHLADRQESVWKRDLPFLEAKVKKQEFTLFCRQLATMYSAGVTLVDAIEAISRQTSSQPLRAALGKIIGDMRGGSSFSAAAAAQPKLFGGVFVHMIEAGEISGQLDEMLHRIAIMYEKENATKGKIKSAMIYPAIMSIAIVGVIAFMMVFVIPTYVENFAAMDVELPLPTRIVMAISDFMLRFWYLLLLGAGGIAVGIYLAARTPNGRYRIDACKLRIPIFGTLIHKQAIARFARTFSSLHAAAVPLLQVLSIVAKVVSNEAIGRVLQEAKENVTGGHSLVEPLRRSGRFPPMVLEMMQVGESTGTLEKMLNKVADYYEADVDTMADRLKSLIEPLLIVVMTVAVGTIVLAIILPSFTLMGNME